MAHLETLSESQLQQLIEQGVHKLEPDSGEDENEFPAWGDDVEAFERFAQQTGGRRYVPQPDSLQGLALWMQHFGYLPPNATLPQRP